MALYGIDISSYQGTLKGQNFTIIKATGGDDGLYVDRTCDTKFQANKKAGKLLGVYHITACKFTPQKEAQYFVSNIKGYIGGALLVLDFETHTNVAWAKAFLDEVYRLTGVRPLIYMSASTTTAANWSSVAKDYALWCAGYPAHFNVANPPTPKADGSDMPFNTGAFPFATIWQYSSSAGTLDRDIAYMARAAWDKFAAVNKPAPPKKEPNAPIKKPVTTKPPQQTPPKPTSPPKKTTPPAQPPVKQSETPAGPPSQDETPPRPSNPPVNKSPEAPAQNPKETKVNWFWQLILNILKLLVGKQ